MPLGIDVSLVALLSRICWPLYTRFAKDRSFALYAHWIGRRRDRLAYVAIVAAG